MPSMFNVKPEDVNENEKRCKYKVSIIGCGPKGIIFGMEFAKVGFQVTCSDPDQSVVKRLSRGKLPFSDPEFEIELKALVRNDRLTVTSELQKAISESDIIVITVPLKVNESKKIDASETLNILKAIGESLRVGTLVIYGETAEIGFIESTAKEILENTSGLKVNKDFILAYVTMNLSTGPFKRQTSLELTIASNGKIGLDATINVLRTITKNTKPALDIKTAEAAALFEAAKKDANRALASELAVFCEKANVDYFEVSKLLNLQEQYFWPSAVDGESKSETYLLLESAENLGAKLTLSALARKINEDMAKYAVNLTQEALRSCNKTLRRAKVALLSSADPSLDIVVLVNLLESKGAKVSLYGSAARKDTFGSEVVKTNLNETVEGADCIVIVSGQGEEQFKNLNLKRLKALTKMPSAVVDLSGALNPQEVQTEGLLYRGFGRGK
jgi:UDP-N-acetyl-D-mannosaminuronic acid dehydrogenase